MQSQLDFIRASSAKFFSLSESEHKEESAKIEDFTLSHPETREEANRLISEEILGLFEIQAAGLFGDEVGVRIEQLLQMQDSKLELNSYIRKMPSSNAEKDMIDYNIARNIAQAKGIDFVNAENDYDLLTKATANDFIADEKDVSKPFLILQNKHYVSFILKKEQGVFKLVLHDSNEASFNVSLLQEVRDKLRSKGINIADNFILDTSANSQDVNKCFDCSISFIADSLGKNYQLLKTNQPFFIKAMQLKKKNSFQQKLNRIALFEFFLIEQMPKINNVDFAAFYKLAVARLLKSISYTTIVSYNAYKYFNELKNNYKQELAANKLPSVDVYIDKIFEYLTTKTDIGNAIEIIENMQCHAQLENLLIEHASQAKAEELVDVEPAASEKTTAVDYKQQLSKIREDVTASFVKDKTKTSGEAMSDFFNLLGKTSLKANLSEEVYNTLVSKEHQLLGLNLSIEIEKNKREFKKEASSVDALFLEVQNISQKHLAAYKKITNPNSKNHLDAKQAFNEAVETFLQKFAQKYIGAEFKDQINITKITQSEQLRFSSLIDEAGVGLKELADNSYADLLVISEQIDNSADIGVINILSAKLDDQLELFFTTTTNYFESLPENDANRAVYRDRMSLFGKNDDKNVDCKPENSPQF